jgi:PAS domain S-box-containing protein
MNAPGHMTAPATGPAADETTLLLEILESVPQAILAVSQDGRVLACNRNAEFIFRVHRADVVSRKYQEALPAALAEVMSRLILSASKGGDGLDREFDFTLDRRTKLPLGISLYPLRDREDRPGGLVFVVRDMSLRHEAQHLRRLHQMNLEFVHTITHEIKAPLTTIQLGAGDLLSQSAAWNDDSLTTLRMIDDAARRIQELVNDFLDVAKLESGRTDLETELGDLGRLAKKTRGRLPPCPKSRHHAGDRSQLASRQIRP